MKMNRVAKAAMLLTAALVAAVWLALPAAAREEVNVSRKVYATEFKFRLPLKTARIGTVTFMIQNKGKVPQA